MSDRMTPIPFGKLMERITDEYNKNGSCFGVYRPYRAESGKYSEIFGRKLETPIGPAAGPHTQLAQNIVSAYFAGSRFFELKTVQKLDGEDLPVSKPCILAEDECYNCEWSTELRVSDAFCEYIKAWFILKVISKEWELGSPSGFQFNMSVGYDLEGIKTEKTDKFIEGMKDARDTDIFKECKTWLHENIGIFKRVTEEDIEAIEPEICNSVTISTLHGCPPQEIERIARYLIEEKGLNTFIKCNPTLLGYDKARDILDSMGYDYIAFTDFHFKDDLQYEDAVPMLERLQKLADEKGLSFGVKITNTFPVDVKRNELPSEEMYMSGKSLYPLSLAVAEKLSRDFNGKLRISYSGGCDFFNIKKVTDAGIWPVTMATTLLKSGGYQRLKQIAELYREPLRFEGTDPEAIAVLCKEALTDKHHIKPVKPLPSRKNGRKVPLTDCFIAPCMETCPIHQDITTYVRLCGEGRYADALRVIIDKNPLPFITGNICPHGCMSKCTRNFYEEPVDIRGTKLCAAEKGFDEIIREIAEKKKPAGGGPELTTDISGKNVVIVGAGPAGISAAFFLLKAGAKVKIFDKAKRAGGVPANIIPEFRIPLSDIEKDIELCRTMGAEFVTGRNIEDIKDLMEEENACACVLAIGAHKKAELKLREGKALNALEFLEEFKEAPDKLSLGENVVVVGGGNTAMDTARAANRVKGVKNVYLVYRRDKRNMPADEEELELCIEDGVIFKELLSPLSHESGELICKKMELGDTDASGRQAVFETNEEERISCDTVIASIGERIDSRLYEINGIATDEKGFPKTDPNTQETSVKNVYAVGDGAEGASVVVKCIASAKRAAEAIAGGSLSEDRPSETTEEAVYAKKGILKEESEEPESKRCLSCDFICESCADVCPNRANIAVRTADGKHQILHVDYMCNECGNCETFCPYSSAPYKDKFTLFADENDMENSENDGFYFKDSEGRAVMRLAGKKDEYEAGKPSKLFKGLTDIIDAVYRDYNWLIL